MSSEQSRIFFYKSLDEVATGTATQAGTESETQAGTPAPSSTSGGPPDVAPTTGTCTDAETFALRVLDDSMEPEFKRGCIIIIDPTGRATDGSFVLARVAPGTLASNRSIAEKKSEVSDGPTPESEGFVFRQLKRGPEPGGVGNRRWHLAPLNDIYQMETTPIELDAVVGVIVQRAGIRRRYHKHYG